MAGLTYASGAASCGVDPSNTGVFVDRTTFPYSADPVGNNTQDNGLAKIDYHLNERNTITGEYFAANYDSLAPQNNGAAQDYWDTFTHAKTMVMGLHWTWLPTSTVVNEARGGFNRYNQLSYPGDCTNIPHPDYSYLANINTNTLPMAGSGLPSNCGFPNITISGGFSSLGCCSSFPKIQGPDWTTQLLDDLSYIRGRHSFKVGYETRHLTYNGGTYGGSKGSFSFTNLTNFLTGTVNASNGASLLVGQPARHLTEWGYAAFAQDDWRIADRFTLNYGLRYETVTPFQASGNLLASFDPSSTTGIVQVGNQVNSLWHRGNNFSPRLGFAWDIQGNAKWVVRAGGSLIYVIEGYNAFVSQQGIAGISVLGLNFDPTGALLNGVAGPGNITTGQVQFPANQVNWTIAGPVLPSGALRCDSPLAPGGGAALAPNNKPCPILTVNPNFRRPYAGAWNLSLQHAFSSNVSLQVAYVGSRGIGLMGMNDINAPTFGSGWATLPAGATKCSPIAPAGIVGASVNTTCENISRPYFSKFPYLSNIIQISNQDYSTYHALQATLTQRPWHGVSYLLGYTWAHSLSEADGDWNGSSLPSNPLSVRDDYGPSENDVRHRMTLSMTYALPEKKGFAQMLEGQAQFRRQRAKCVAVDRE